VGKKLTDITVERLGKKAEPYVVWDAVQIGLGIKVTPRGKRIWVEQLRYPGYRCQSTRTLGHYPAMSLAQARTKAGQWYAWVKAGIDPEQAEAEEKARADTARRAETLKKAHTFASVAERYIGEHLDRQRRGKVTAREIRSDLIEAWGERPISDIKPGDVKTLIHMIKARAPYQARNAFGHARTLFRWAVHHDLIEASPIASLEPRWVLDGAKIGPRQRTLTEEEIAAFWRATGRLGYPYGCLFRMLLLTACRLNEVARAQWSELHPELCRVIREAKRAECAVDWGTVPEKSKRWTIPAARFKSDVEHIVPLSNDVCALLESLPRFSAGDFLFTTTDGEKPINGLSKSKHRLDKRMLRNLRAMGKRRGDDAAQVKLPGWVLHDLRRVVRTHLSALEVPDHVAEMVLGHGRKGLQRVYDQHRYEPQIREALERWAARLREIVQPTSPPPQATLKNVVMLPLRRRAGR
jgi:integrase